MLEVLRHSSGVRGDTYPYSIHLQNLPQIFLNTLYKDSKKSYGDIKLSYLLKSPCK